MRSSGGNNNSSGGRKLSLLEAVASGDINSAKNIATALSQNIPNQNNIHKQELSEKTNEVISAKQAFESALKSLPRDDLDASDLSAAVDNRNSCSTKLSQASASVGVADGVLREKIGSFCEFHESNALTKLIELNQAKQSGTGVAEAQKAYDKAATQRKAALELSDLCDSIKPDSKIKLQDAVGTWLADNGRTFVEATTASLGRQNTSPSAIEDISTSHKSLSESLAKEKDAIAELARIEAKIVMKVKEYNATKVTKLENAVSDISAAEKEYEVSKSLLEKANKFQEATQYKQHLISDFEKTITTTGINQRDKTGKTPLHIAAERRDLAMVKMLIANGADPTLQDNTQSTPLHLVFQALHGVDGVTKSTLSSLLPGKSKADSKSEIVNALMDGRSDAEKQQLLNMPDEKGRTAFYIATKVAIGGNGDTKIPKSASLLLQHGASQRILTTDLKAPLGSSIAVQNESFLLLCGENSDNAELAKNAIANGAQINCTDTKGNTPLILACTSGKNNKIELVRFLLSDKPFSRDRILFRKDGYFNEESKAKENLAIPLRVNKPLPDVNLFNNDGYAALHMVCSNRNSVGKKDLAQEGELTATIDTEMLKLLIIAGADVNATTQPNGSEARKTALQIIETIHVDSPERDDLIASLEKTPEQLKKELAFQSECRENRVNRLLPLPGKEIINSRDSSGNTPLHLACINGNTALVNSLIAAGAELNSHNYEGHSPLHLAAKSLNADVYKSLLSAGADPLGRNRADSGQDVKVGQTPLALATETNRPLRNEMVLATEAKLRPLLASSFPGNDFSQANSKSVDVVRAIVLSGESIYNAKASMDAGRYDSALTARKNELTQAKAKTPPNAQEVYKAESALQKVQNQMQGILLQGAIEKAEIDHKIAQEEVNIPKLHVHMKTLGQVINKDLASLKLLESEKALEDAKSKLVGHELNANKKQAENELKLAKAELESDTPKVDLADPFEDFEANPVLEAKVREASQKLADAEKNIQDHALSEQISTCEYDLKKATAVLSSAKFNSVSNLSKGGIRQAEEAVSQCRGKLEVARNEPIMLPLRTARDAAKAKVEKITKSLGLISKGEGSVVAGAPETITMQSMYIAALASAQNELRLAEESLKNSQSKLTHIEKSNTLPAAVVISNTKSPFNRQTDQVHAVSTSQRPIKAPPTLPGVSSRSVSNAISKNVSSSGSARVKPTGDQLSAMQENYGKMISRRAPSTSSSVSTKSPGSPEAHMKSITTTPLNQRQLTAEEIKEIIAADTNSTTTTTSASPPPPDGKSTVGLSVNDASSGGLGSILNPTAGGRQIRQSITATTAVDKETGFNAGSKNQINAELQSLNNSGLVRNNPFKAPGDERGK